jgi:hypothetical protein
VELARVGEQAGLAANGEHYRQANVDTFLQATFERYFASQTLFGTPETCAALVDRLRDVGVTEIACLIDFGVDVDRVLGSLPLLERLRATFTDGRSDAAVDRDAAHAAITRSGERVQSRTEAMQRQARLRVSAGVAAGRGRKDDRA